MFIRLFEMRRVLIFYTFLICLLFSSCHEDVTIDFAKQIQGSWDWEKSVGGIGGWTLSPQTEHYTKTLIINANTVKEYRDEQLIFLSPYQLKIDSNSTDRYYYLEFTNGPANQIIWFEDQHLMLYDLISDGYGHRYSRKFH